MIPSLICCSTFTFPSNF